MSEISFTDLVRKRRTVRGFLSTPLTQEQINSVLEDTSWSSSNANTRPWHVHIVSG